MDDLTDKDRQLISLLQEDARMAISVLARRLGVSRTTVQDRLRRLERTGAISGYRVKLRDDIARPAVRAFVTIEVDQRSTVAVVSALKRMPGIRSVHTVSGKYDLVAVAGAVSTAEMDLLLDDLGELDGVIRTESSIILSTKFDRSEG